jgi:ABC-type uncharacterized transport system ATPase subunit
MDLVERVADRVLLLNRGREILSGALADLHGRLDPRPRLRLTLEPGAGVPQLGTDPDVDELTAEADGLRITLREGVPIARFLARAAALAPVRGIATETPRLHDLFVRAVREDDARAGESAA